jgi:hypothetical protein
MTPMEPHKRNDGFVTLGGPRPGPCCPQFRSFVLDRLHPVTGYCDLGEQPRRLMVPTVELYRVHCCSWQFDACPWYQKEGGSGELNLTQEETDG